MEETEKLTVTFTYHIEIAQEGHDSPEVHPDIIRGFKLAEAAYIKPTQTPFMEAGAEELTFQRSPEIAHAKGFKVNIRRGYFHVI